MRNLIVASAGAGKSQRIVDEAMELAKTGKKVLLISYTVNNQDELYHRIRDPKYENHNAHNITVKGWFSFLLEDVIRPYQKALFSKRIDTHNFNKTDPHKNKKGYTIPGRAEIINGKVNALHYLTASGDKAHTTYLSKLACRIIIASKAKPTLRLKGIYAAIYIDEVQDLTGWDLHLLKCFCQGQLPICCVGDFRQTIYRTHNSTKKPTLAKEKLAFFKKLNFVVINQNISRRCIQDICTFADLINISDNYPPTQSLVTKVENEYAHHQGIYAVKPQDLDDYLDKYRPIILRWGNASSPEICTSRTNYTFGKSKGLGFDRILIIPTDNYDEFLKGNDNPFKGKTDSAKNKLYVAITRARYSVAFISKDWTGLRKEVKVWDRATQLCERLLEQKFSQPLLEAE